MATGNFEVKGVLSVEDRMSNVLKNAQSSLSSFGNISKSSFSGASSSMDSMSGSAEKARSAIMSIAAGVGAVQVVGKAFDLVENSVSGAISRFDTLNQYPKVMEQLGYSAKDVSKSMDTLQNGIKGLPTALDDVVSTTQQFASITGDVDTAAKTTIALNDAFLASGASSADAARGLQQYTQMLSSGKVDMMSWRTLQETMPASLKKVAEAFGFTGRAATNDLYAALQSGTITMDQLNQKFVELDGGVTGFANQARTASAGIQTSFDNLGTAVTRGMANMLKAIDSGLTSNGFPTMAASINKGQDLIDAGFQKLNGSIPGMITNFKNFGGSLAPLSGLLTAVATGVLGLMAFSTVAPQVNATFIALKNVGSAFSVILSPIGLIAAGIALLAVAFYKAYTTSEPFRNSVDSLAKTLHSGFDKTVQSISKAFEAMGINIGSSTSIFEALNKILGTTKGQMAAFAGGVGMVALGLLKLTSPAGLIKSIFGSLGSIFSKLTPSLGGTSSAVTGLGTSMQVSGNKASSGGSLFSGFSGAVLKVGLAVGVAAAGLGVFAFGIAAIAAQGENGIDTISSLSMGITMIIAVLALCSPLLTANASGLDALGTNALKVGAAIAIVSLGFAVFTAAITQLANTGTSGVIAVAAITVAIIALAATFAILGPKLTSSVVGIVGFGAAVALIGVGIGVATAGIALMITAFTGLIAVSSQIPAAMMAVGVGFTAMMVAILSGVVANVALITQAFTAMGAAILTSIITLAPLVGQAFLVIAQTILMTLATLLPQIIALIGNTITQILTMLVSIMPQIQAFLISLGTMIIAVLTALLPQVLTLLGTAIIQILTMLLTLAPQITALIVQIFLAILATITAYVPQIVAGIVNLLVAIITAIGEQAPRIVAAFLLMLTDMVEALIQMTPLMLQILTAMLVAMVAVIASYFGAFQKLGMLLLKALGMGLIGQKVDVVGKASDIMKESGTGAAKAGMDAFDKAGGNSAKNAIKAIANKNGDAKTTGGKLSSSAAKGMDSKKAEAKTAGTNVGNAGKSGAESTKGSWRSVGSNLAAGLAAGISAGRSAAVNAARSIARDAVNAAKAEAKIHSPSRVMKYEVGKYLALGMAVGMTSYSGAVQNAAQGLADNAIPDIRPSKISDSINATNKQLQTGLQANIDSKLSVGSQPANISLQMGNTVYGAFVDDVTKQQSTATSLRIDRRF